MALPNIIISKDGNIGFIDFGQMSFGNPELDIYDSIWSIQRNLGPNYGEYFLEKYGPIQRTKKIEYILNFKYKPATEE
jgi:aminoglycoside phosphotransferase